MVTTLIIYVFVLFAVAVYANSKSTNLDEFLVAGRRLTLPFSVGTLFATWFGAGTLITVSDEVYQTNVLAAAMDPLGAGVCLILAGIFFARYLWEAKLYTLQDLFGRCFGVRVEIFTSFAMVPTYFGWIAVQFISLAELLRIFTGLDFQTALLLVSFIGAAYTVIGGMWSVTLTDLLQVILVISGLSILTYEMVYYLANTAQLQGEVALLGFREGFIWDQTTSKQVFDAMNWFVIGAIGNLPGQDLCQRIFAAKSATVARRACLLSGVLYLIAGLMPVFIGLAAKEIFATGLNSGALFEIAKMMLSPVLLHIFIIAVLSAVLSTVDSAILSPATVIAQNLLPKLFKLTPSKALNQACIILVTVISLVTAMLGESAYELLQSAYEMQLVALFACLVIAVYGKNHNGSAMFWTLMITSGFWVFSKILGIEAYMSSAWDQVFANFQVSLLVTIASFLLYFVLVNKIEDKEAYVRRQI